MSLGSYVIACNKFLKIIIISCKTGLIHCIFTLRAPKFPCFFLLTRRNWPVHPTPPFFFNTWSPLHLDTDIAQWSRWSKRQRLWFQIPTVNFFLLTSIFIYKRNIYWNRAFVFPILKKTMSSNPATHINLFFLYTAFTFPMLKKNIIKKTFTEIQCLLYIDRSRTRNMLALFEP